MACHALRSPAAAAALRPLPLPRLRRVPRLRRATVPQPCVRVSHTLCALTPQGAALLAPLALCSLAGNALERHTPVGRALSAPVATMLCGAFLASAGFQPPSDALRALQSILVYASTPMLLFGANISRLVRGAGPLLPTFAAGALGTFVGAAVGVSLFAEPLTRAMPVAEVGSLASALSAKNIGGGFNFVAVCDATGIGALAVALGLAADNLAALIYFPLNGWLAGPPSTSTANELASAGWTSSPSSPTGEDFSTAGELTSVLAVSLGIVYVVQVVIGAGGNTAAAAAGITVILATLFPSLLSPLERAGNTLGRVLLGLFFASAGVAGGRIVTNDPGALAAVGALLLVIYAFHGLFTAISAHVCRLSRLDAAIVSNAGIGGPATAAALASSKRAPDPAPGILLGTLGNATATFLALGATPLLSKLV